ncbi:MAG: hypothetical protein R2784_05850 [Saprospiraceae bacterium]
MDTTRTISNLTAGTYTLLVIDGNNCMVDTMVVIIGSQLMISVMAEDETCPGANDGSVISATGGTSPYTFTWSNMQSGPTITNLSPGSYTVTVEDSGGCTATATVNIQAGTGNKCFCNKNRISVVLVQMMVLPVQMLPAAQEIILIHGATVQIHQTSPAYQLVPIQLL